MGWFAGGIQRAEVGFQAGNDFGPPLRREHGRLIDADGNRFFFRNAAAQQAFNREPLFRRKVFCKVSHRQRSYRRCFIAMRQLILRRQKEPAARPPALQNQCSANQCNLRPETENLSLPKSAKGAPQQSAERRMRWKPVTFLFKR
jgi:hypothetical protein